VSFNGWTNQATWMVNAWLYGEGCHWKFLTVFAEEAWRDAAAAAAAEEENIPKPAHDLELARCERAAVLLGVRIKEYALRQNPPPRQEGMNTTRVQASLEQVAWDEIAEHVFSWFDGAER
jgi:hypothetical protein